MQHVLRLYFFLLAVLFNHINNILYYIPPFTQGHYTNSRLLPFCHEYKDNMIYLIYNKLLNMLE